MGRLTLCLCLIFLIFPSYAISDTIIYGGPVTGQWYFDGSPYLIRGEIVVPESESLIIDPGVEVIFEVYARFLISGLLQAQGNADDSIRFSAIDSAGWGGMRFRDATHTSILEYCILENGWAHDVGPSDNKFGGGIFIKNSNLVLGNSRVRKNTADTYGGGICCIDASPIIYNCDISDNYSEIGGGIACITSNALIERCVIVRNMAWGHAGAFFCYNGGHPTFTHCTIVDNFFFFDWPLCASQCSISMKNCIATGRLDLYYSSGENEIEYNMLSQEYTFVWNSNYPPGLGEMATYNQNGDTCDVYNNICMNPSFAMTDSAYYYPRFGSYCINAGDPASPLDPDSTIADIGAYPYDPDQVLASPFPQISTFWLNFDSVEVGHSATLPYMIRNRGNADLIIQGINVIEEAFFTDYSSSDSLIAPGDSLILAVTFAPLDTSHYYDTLFVVTNDTLTGPLFSYCLGIEANVTGVINKDPHLFPSTFGILSIYPNPFNMSTIICYELPVTRLTRLSVYDIQGRQVAELIDGWRDAGVHEVMFDGTGLASGRYFYRLEAGEYSAQGRMILLK